MFDFKSNICYNCYLCMFKKIDELPFELKELIFHFISGKNKILLNKFYYNKYHYSYEIDYNESYVRKMIRNNYYFLFENYLMTPNIREKMEKRKIYVYKNKKYKNYKEYLSGLCDIYEAFKCKILL